MGSLMFGAFMFFAGMYLTAKTTFHRVTMYYMKEGRTRKSAEAKAKEVMLYESKHI